MDDITKSLGDYFAKILLVHGIKDSSLAILLAVLYLEPNEISMEDLAKKTGYSLASISIKLKSLEYFFMVKKYTKPKSKRVYVYMEKDFTKE